MAILKVARMGHPVLRKKARELSKEEIKSSDIQRLVQDMVETMREYSGIGLAAPQVHESMRLAVIELSPENSRYPGHGEHPLMVLFNPKVTVLDSSLQGAWEGCLSIPEVRGWVKRPRKIQVDFLDLGGVERTLVAEGFLATVFQHELDHLDGRLFIDLIKDTTRLAFLTEYQRYWQGEPEVD
jgi:peptide deformylase